MEPLDLIEMPKKYPKTNGMYLMFVGELKEIDKLKRQRVVKQYTHTYVHPKLYDVEEDNGKTYRENVMERMVKDLVDDQRI